MKKLKYLIILFFALLLANAIRYHYSSSSIVDDIKLPINGIVINKYSTGHGRFIVIKEKNGNTFEFNQDNIYDYLRKGDYFIKQANDNYCFVTRSGQTKKKYSLLYPQSQETHLIGLKNGNTNGWTPQKLGKNKTGMLVRASCSCQGK